VEVRIDALERAEEHLAGRVHALEHAGDPDRLREVLTRLRHVRARLAEARFARARPTDRVRSQREGPSGADGGDIDPAAAR
jgi:predicted ATPase